MRVASRRVKGMITMGKVRRKFTDEFKFNLVSQITSGSTSAATAARKHQISPNLVYRWIRSFKGRSADEIVHQPSTREKELARENAALKEKLADLFMQNELLKKAETWMAQRKSATSSVITSSNLARYKKGVK